MVIHHYQQFYAGPSSPGPAQPRKLTRRLAERGHHVLVVACDFNAYSEQTEPEEDMAFPGGGRVKVYRLPAPRRLRTSLMARLRAYGWFAWRAYLRGKHLGPPNVVLGSIQPLFTGFAALQDARAHKAPFVLEVRDLWPDALVAKGAITQWQAKPMYWMEARLYARAQRVVSLTPGIKVELLRKGVSRERLDVLPNAFDAEAYRLEPNTRERVRKEHGWDNRFVVVYTGAHTEVTAVDTLVRAAHVLRDRQDIRFELFGAGQTKPFAQSLAASLELTNIGFRDSVPKASIPQILAGADAGLMSLFKSPLIHIYFENKLVDYMGAGIPILAAMDGMQAEIVRRFGAGQVVGSCDYTGLARLIADAADNPSSAQAMGRQGRRMIERHLLQANVLERYCDLLEAVAEGRSQSVVPWEPFAE